MLENAGVGQRSGVSPVSGLLRSQKKAKVRCWTVSRSAAIRAGVGPGTGAVVGVLHAKTIVPARANSWPGRARSERDTFIIPERDRATPGGPGVPRPASSEGHLPAQLDSARVGHHAPGLPEVGVGSISGVVAAEVVPIERVEHVERDAERGAPDPREVLSKLEVQVPVRERSGHGEAARLVGIARRPHAAKPAGAAD